MSIKQHKGIQEMESECPCSETRVLVGTYRTGQLEKWPGYYNYPISDGDGIDPDECAQARQVWLFRGKAALKVFHAEFLGVKTREELKNEYGYQGRGKAHGTRYLLYKLGYAEEADANPGKVIYRLKDFVTAPDVLRKLKQTFIETGHIDSEFRKLLPEKLLALKPEQVCVCEPGIQLDFVAALLKTGVKKKSHRIGPTFIDLFAGCGGLSLGLERAGFTPLLVNELNSDAMATYLLNRRDEFPWLCDNNVANVKDLVLNEDLLERFRSSIRREFGIDIFNGELDLICGGPPCQGYSGLGIRRSYSVEKKQLPSNYLYQDMAFLVNKIRPKIFLFENVRGLLAARWTNGGKKGEIFEDVLRTFRAIGAYHVRFKLVHAKDYGVPQNRPRVLIVGLRKDLFPAPSGDGDAVECGFLPRPVGGYPGIEELLGDLMDPRYRRGEVTKVYPRAPQNEVQRRLRTRRDGSIFAAGDAVSEMEYSNHSDFIVEKFTEMIRNGGIIPERFKTKKFAQKVLPRTWGKDGPSITACSAPDDYVHFAQPRSLTVREWARLQMFPDWYVFAGKRTTGGLRRAGNPREGIFDRELPKYTQIGNAVPVELAFNVGKHFAHLLQEAGKHVESREHVG